MGKLNLEKFHRLLEIVDVDRSGNVTYRKNGKPVPVYEGPDHYLRANVQYAGRNLGFKIHTLVAVRWLGDPPDGKDQVSHLDQGKTNNKVENLAWASAVENMNMPLRRQRGSAAMPFEKCSASKNKYKKKVAQYTMNDKFIAEFESVNAAARAVGGHSGGISHCCSGGIQSYYGYVWKWA